MAEPTRPRWPATYICVSWDNITGLLVMVVNFVTFFGHHGVALRGIQIGGDHLSDEFTESDFRAPAQLFLGLGRVSQQGFNLSGSEITRIDVNQGLAGGPVYPDFVDPFALP